MAALTRRMWFLIGGIGALFVGILIVVLALTLGRGSDLWEGLLYQPRTEDHLIRFKSGNIGVWGPLVADLGVFLENYNRPHSDHSKIVDCNWSLLPTEGKVCDFRLKNLGPSCNIGNKYGYEEGKPCVFIYPVKKPDWVPEYYQNSHQLPQDMPEELQKYIKEVEATDRQKLQTLWLSCNGEDAVDVEHIGVLNYSKFHGFPSYYFPYKEQEEYLSPLVAVQFTSLIDRIAVSVKCRVWAKNIGEYDGFVKFQILKE